MKTILFSMIILCSTMGMAQRQMDTAKVIILYVDTTVVFRGQVITTEGFKDAYSKDDNAHWTFAYSVRELHNTGEDVNDAGAMICIDQEGNQVSCFHDYWMHVKYHES